MQKYNKAEVGALANRIRSGTQQRGGNNREVGIDRPNLANGAADVDNTQLSTSNPTAQPLDASPNEDAHAQTVISQAPTAEATSRAPPKQFQVLN